jgi:hypothetical protein
MQKEFPGKLRILEQAIGAFRGSQLLWTSCASHSVGKSVYVASPFALSSDWN